MRPKLPRKVRRSPDGRYHIVPLYTIPLGPLYQKILRPPLKIERSLDFIKP